MPRHSVVFDFGNVIAFFDHGKACRQLAQLSSAPIDQALVHAAIFDTEVEAAYDSGRLSTAQFIARLRRELSLQASDADIGRAWSDIFTPNAAIASVIPALEARGLRLVLGSNTNELHRDWFGRVCAETLDVFDAQVLSYHIGCRKPDRRFFEACIAASRCAASECVYIDDRADFVAAGRALGMDGILYAPGLDIESLLGL